MANPVAVLKRLRVPQLTKNAENAFKTVSLSSNFRLREKVAKF
jgi:hypothetical protein